MTAQPVHYEVLRSMEPLERMAFASAVHAKDRATAQALWNAACKRYSEAAR